MQSIIIKAIAIGAVVGIIVGVLLNAVPFIDNLVPDNANSLISGGIAGAVVGAMVVGVKKNN